MIVRDEAVVVLVAAPSVDNFLFGPKKVLAVKLVHNLPLTRRRNNALEGRHDRILCFVSVMITTRPIHTSTAKTNMYDIHIHRLPLENLSIIVV